jgi:hypothetical protein
MMAWTGQGSDADFEESFQSLLGLLGSNRLVGQWAGLMKIPPAALRDMWNSPRGRGLARRSALHDIPHRDYIRHPLLLLAVAATRAGAMPDMTGEEEKVVWKLAEEVLDLYTTGKFPKTHVGQLALAWEGDAGFFGWGSLAPRLPSSVRGATAYVLGFRFEKLPKGKDQSRWFFETALKDAAPDSTLQKLARAQIERLSKP